MDSASSRSAASVASCECSKASLCEAVDSPGAMKGPPLLQLPQMTFLLAFWAVVEERFRVQDHMARTMLDLPFRRSERGQYCAYSADFFR